MSLVILHTEWVLRGDRGEHHRRVQLIPGHALARRRSNRGSAATSGVSLQVMFTQPPSNVTDALFAVGTGATQPGVPAFCCSAGPAEREPAPHAWGRHRSRTVDDGLGPSPIGAA